MELFNKLFISLVGTSPLTIITLGGILYKSGVELPTIIALCGLVTLAIIISVLAYYIRTKFMEYEQILNKILDILLKKDGKKGKKRDKEDKS